MDLSGKTALVTGSSSGIGRGIALAFAQHGANVVITGRNQERIAQVVREAEASGGTAVGSAPMWPASARCRPWSSRPGPRSARSTF